MQRQVLQVCRPAFCTVQKQYLLYTNKRSYTSKYSKNAQKNIDTIVKYV